MVKNTLLKYEILQKMLIDLKAKQGSEMIDVTELRKAIAINFNIIDHVAQKRFLISLDKLGLIDGKATPVGKVRVCL